MQIFKKFSLFAMLFAMVFGISNVFASTGDLKKISQNFFESVQAQAKNGVGNQAEFQKIIGAIASKEKISKNFCGVFDENVSNAVISYFALMLNTKAVNDVLLAKDCTFTVDKVIENKTQCAIKSGDVHIKIVMLFNAGKIVDIQLDEIQLSRSLMSQIQSYIKDKHKKSLREIDKSERGKMVVEAINAILPK